MTPDVFEKVRRTVSARDIAERNGFHANRTGFIECPFHNEKTPSLKLYEDGHWYCFGCGQGGSSVDFAMRLYGVSALEAVRRLDSDFHLGLELDRPLNRNEQEVAKHRREISETYRLFENWRSDFLNLINECCREAHIIQQTDVSLEELTERQTLALKWQPRLEYLSDVLSSGTMAEKIGVFRERGKIGQLCSRILDHTPEKSCIV